MQPANGILANVVRVISEPRRLFRVLGLLGAGLLVFAARSREIHLHAGDIPVIDQWKGEAADILLPWVNGSLALKDFLQPHNGHVPVWSRLLVWLEAVAGGRWDPRLQMAVNAALHAGFVMVFLRWLWSALAFRPALAASGLLLATAMLPFAWENITWGFQSQFPLALLALVLYVPGTLGHPPFSRRWWWAQAAGLAGLFTLGVMWTAPLAAGLVLAWTRAGDRRAWPVLAGLMGVGVALTVIAPTATDSLLFVHSLPVFLQAWFVQLGWPTTTVFINVPLVLLALQLRGRRDAAGFDRAVLALGIWSVLQGAAIAYARSAEYIGFTSRYGDLLAVGLVANFLALLRLAPTSRARALAAAGVLAWVGVAAHGLYTITTTAHTAYFHQHSAERNAVREEAVRSFLQDQNIGHLAGEQVRAALFPDPAQVARLLEQPKLRVLLPLVSGPARLGAVVRTVQAQWAWLGAVALAVVLTGVVAEWRHAGAVPALTWTPDPWRKWILAGLALLSLAGLFLWWRPLVFGEVARKKAILGAPGTIAPLRYEFTGPAPYPPERIVGAAQVSPGEVRNIFHGPVDLAAVRSNSFHLITPYLVVPFAGHPAAPGIALRVVVEDGRGGTVHTYTCPAVASGEVGFWELDVTENQKRSAHLELVDQSADPQGWIAVAPPQYAWKPGQGAIRTQAWAEERLAPAHQALGWISLLALLGCGWVWRRAPGSATPATTQATTAGLAAAEGRAPLP